MKEHILTSKALGGLMGKLFNIQTLAVIFKEQFKWVSTLILTQVPSMHVES